MNQGSRKTFVETLWDLDEKQLIQTYITGRRQDDSTTAMAILEAKATLAAQEAVTQSAAVARQTRILAWATIILALATVALVAVTIMKGS